MCPHPVTSEMVRDRATGSLWQTPGERLQFAPTCLFRRFRLSFSVSLRRDPSLRAQKRIIFLASVSVGFISPRHRVAYLVRTVRLSAPASSASSSIFRRDFFSPGRTFLPGRLLSSQFCSCPAILLITGKRQETRNKEHMCSIPFHLVQESRASEQQRRVLIYLFCFL